MWRTSTGYASLTRGYEDVVLRTKYEFRVREKSDLIWIRLVSEKITFFGVKPKNPRFGPENHPENTPEKPFFDCFFSPFVKSKPPFVCKTLPFVKSNPPFIFRLLHDYNGWATFDNVELRITNEWTKDIRQQTTVFRKYADNVSVDRSLLPIKH